MNALNPLENLIWEKILVSNRQIDIPFGVFKTPEQFRVVRDSPSDFSRVVSAPQSAPHKDFLRHIKIDDENIITRLFELHDALRVQDDDFLSAIWRFKAFFGRAVADMTECGGIARRFGEISALFLFGKKWLLAQCC